MKRRTTHNPRIRALTGAAMLSFALLAGSGAFAQTEPIEVLLTTTATEATRLEAASRILRSEELSGREVRRLSEILDPQSEDPVARRLVLIAIGAMPMVSAELEEPLIDLVARCEPQMRPRALEALGSVGTWEAARVLVNHAAPFQTGEVSQAATDTLVRMTGRSDIGTDHEAWQNWLRERSDLDTEAWRAELIRGLTRRVRTLADSERDATTRAVDGYRRLYMVSPFQEKSPLLAELLLIDGELRRLAIDLVYRELSQGTQLGGEIGTSAIELLKHVDDEVRAEGARLISTLSPREAGEPVTEALVAETSPLAAAAILNAAAKWPGVAVISPALRWLEFGAATRDSASKLLLALDDEGLLTAPADRRRVADALRAAGPSRLTPDGVRLITRMGTDSDREAIAALLESGQKRDLQHAAATELARRPEFFDRIISAAEREPTLFAAAVSATINHRRSVEGYALVRRLAPNDAQRRDGLLKVARSLPPAELLQAARTQEPNPELRIAVLSEITRVATSDEEQQAIDEAMILLAETNLERSRPADALRALQTVSESASEENKARVAFNETIAYLWLNRIDEAAETGASPDAWLRAIELIGDEPHVGAVAGVALERFTDVLSAEEQARLRAIADEGSTAEGG